MLILSKKQWSSRTQQTPPPQGWGPGTDTALKGRWGERRSPGSHFVLFPSQPVFQTEVTELLLPFLVRPWLHSVLSKKSCLSLPNDCSPE